MIPAGGGAPLAIAHRAGNSLEGLHAALAAGADLVEADVWSHGGRLEVRHLKTAGPLPFLWDAWRVVPAWRPRLLLPEVLEAAAGGATFLLDLKGRTPDVGEHLAALLHEAAPGREVWVCSRLWPSLDRFLPLDWARVMVSARTGAEVGALRERVRRGDVDGVAVHRSHLSTGLVDELHRSVRLVTTWPVNDPGALERVAALGVSGVTTDDPGVLAALVAARRG
ncbi:glycerophosphodiester phosphodiesterase [Vallicoccus soli]|uniref:Glycerophosphodiester phosphodiesterase n=1 Tax=Vallicoccus soli TaxID=2339232 RepID=A0A3A3YXU9_9ACTN|nr:glycerophosphodiester phosphodiesterase [Vallicoccus soli]RJK94783.1 glycerophosphodiester phosphodiesterase [Vallicoccus soli]